MLAHRSSHDLRGAQDPLGYNAPRPHSRYARVLDLVTSNPVLKVAVKLS